MNEITARDSLVYVINRLSIGKTVGFERRNNVDRPILKSNSSAPRGQVRLVPSPLVKMTSLPYFRRAERQRF
jgi:hypothetical protein